MGTTGLIYVAIVAAWAAYLVPMLLKRNDEASARRSAEKYSSSEARVLSRATDVQARSRYVVRPPGQSPDEVQRYEHRWLSCSNHDHDLVASRRILGRYYVRPGLVTNRVVFGHF